MRHHGFWPLALLWLPVGVAVQAAARFVPATDAPRQPGVWVAAVLMSAASLVVLATCGLPLSLVCRRLWRFRHLYRRAAGATGIGLGASRLPQRWLRGCLVRWRS